MDILNKLPCTFYIYPRFTEKMLHGSMALLVGMFPDGTYSLSSHLKEKGVENNAQEIGCVNFFL